MLSIHGYQYNISSVILRFLISPKTVSGIVGFEGFALKLLTWALIGSESIYCQAAAAYTFRN